MFLVPPKVILLILFHNANFIRYYLFFHQVDDHIIINTTTKISIEELLKIGSLTESDRNGDRKYLNKLMNALWSRKSIAQKTFSVSSSTSSNEFTPEKMKFVQGTLINFRTFELLEKKLIVFFCYS